MVNKLYKIFSGVFFTVMIVIALAVLVSAFPIRGNFQIKVVLSGSMEPTIKTGSLVVIVPGKVYEKGDIITFTSTNFRGPKGEIIPVTHRIYEVKNENSVISYVTKGDANEEPDETPIRSTAVIGKVFFWIPYAGYVIDVARKPYGFLALIIIPSLIIIFDQGKVIFDELKKRKNQPGKKEETPVS